MFLKYGRLNSNLGGLKSRRKSRPNRHRVTEFYNHLGEMLILMSSATFNFLYVFVYGPSFIRYHTHIMVKSFAQPTNNLILFPRKRSCTPDQYFHFILAVSLFQHRNRSFAFLIFLSTFVSTKFQVVLYFTSNFLTFFSSVRFVLFFVFFFKLNFRFSFSFFP